MLNYSTFIINNYVYLSHALDKENFRDKSYINFISQPKFITFITSEPHAMIIFRFIVVNSYCNWTIFLLMLQTNMFLVIGFLLNVFKNRK